MQEINVAELRKHTKACFTATHRTVSVHRVLQMRGGGYTDVLPVLQVPDNKADVVPCERLRKRQYPV
jgi:hypothetical protein